MESKSKVKELGSKRIVLSGMTPTRSEQILSKIRMAVKRKPQPLYEMSPTDRETLFSTLEDLKKRGEEVPEIDKKAMYVPTGPRSGRLESRDGTISLEIPKIGPGIFYSINDGPKMKLTMGGLQS